MAKSDKAQDLEQKIRIVNEIAVTAFQMFDVQDLETLLSLLRERRKLKCSALYAAANSKSGQSLQHIQGQLAENTAALTDLTYLE